MKKGLKEKVKTVPKELVRRGLDDGTERLRGQLRDAAQNGQPDDYGCDRIEDTADRGARRAERGVESLLKNRRKRARNQDTGTDPRASSESSAVPDTLEDTPLRDSTDRPRIKTRESGAHTASTGSGTTRTSHPDASKAGRMAIKTKDTYIQQQPSTPLEEPSQALTQGQREFAQEQGRKLKMQRTAQSRHTGWESVPSSKGGDPSPPAASARHGDVAGQIGRTPAQTAYKPGHTDIQPTRKNTSNGRSLIKTARSGRKATKRTARKTIKTAERTSQKTVKISHRTVKTVQKTGQATVKATQRAVQAARAATETAVATAKTAAKATAAAAKAAIAAIQQLAAAIAAGGWVVIVIVVVICLSAMLIASPFGILFTDDGNAPDAVSPSAAVAQINGELADRLSELQAGGIYDGVEIQGQPPSWAEVLAVFAAKTAGAENGVDVATLDPDRVGRLRVVFWDMTKITTETKTVEIPASGDTPARTETVLAITITPRTPDDMRVFYSFTVEQNKALDELLANADMLTALAGDLTITSQDAKALLTVLPADLSPERRAVVETACRLVGKVNYFWGGKSLVIGWDSRWGQLRRVTAEGSSTTGSYRPYGMDCSGFVDWVFYNITNGDYIIGHGGGAHMQHTYCADITWDEAQPGDLVFYPDDEHIGIVGGWDDSGNLLIIHCASSANNVVITGKSGFTSIARPNYYSS